MSMNAEFYESAVRSGYYGVDRSGLFGKKDNVRKFWEDMSIKLLLRPAIEQILREKGSVRIVDLGSGSGEGFELLTHIPPQRDVAGRNRDFVLDEREIAAYVGLDLSPGMVRQGRDNYRGKSAVRFHEADLGLGFPLTEDPPYDIYFSSYGSLSHLTRRGLVQLLTQISAHVTEHAYIVVDLLGRLSPEWPVYWQRSADEMLPYNMAYLLPAEERFPRAIEWFRNSFWSSDELISAVNEARENSGRRIEVTLIKDRSILVGRHMETGLFGARSWPLRHQVNRLLDHGYRGQVEMLHIDAEMMAAGAAQTPKLKQRLTSYCRDWNSIIAVLGALMSGNDRDVQSIREDASPRVSEDIEMLVWLCRNARRFVVADFWASVLGPQVAVILRSIELDQDDAIGCGHGLFAILRASNTPLTHRASTD